jgi:transcriptional regulator with XRE-family HTH domain
MKLLFSNEWMRNRIATDPEDEPEAGVPPTETVEGFSVATRPAHLAVLSERNSVQMRNVLGMLIRQLRSNRGLSVSALAERADVSEDELRQVERDPHYTASPRLLFKLSDYFDVSLVTLSQVAGATHEVDRVLFNGAVKFAAHSDEAVTLTREEQDLLARFVSLVNERAKA